MTYNLQSRKTPIYGNINDIPVPPTSQAAGNGADLLARINGLVDDTETALNALETGKLDLSASADFFLVNDTRPLQMGIYSPQATLTVSTDKTAGNELILDLAQANVFRVNIDANSFSDAVDLRVNSGDRYGQIFVILFVLSSSGMGGTLALSPTDFFLPITPPDILNDGDFQAITFVSAGGGGGFGAGSASVLEIARGPVKPYQDLGGGY